MEGDSHFWSLSAENDWVCEDATRGSNLFMAQCVGYILNTLFFMQLTDRYFHSSQSICFKSTNTLRYNFIFSWGRAPVFHITNATYIVSRLFLLFFHDYYWLSLIVIALGSGFYPIGIRVAYILSKYCAQSQY